MHRRALLGRVVGLAGLGSVGTAGCLGGGDGEADGTQDETTTRMATATDTETTAGDGEQAAQTPTETTGTAEERAQEVYPDYDWEKLEDVSQTATQSITLRNTVFRPLVATVPPGTDVTYTNEDSYGHTVTVPRLGVDTQLSGGDSTTVTFEAEGTYDYVCTLHSPGMLGRVVVSAEATAGGQSPTTTSAPSPTTTDSDGSDPYG